ncbi:MAG TPA: phytoene/squalene synthase family protein [Steroidobacteraceae bacterium]|nr:phytoene/squalene synthase family protein [Steroidobacteraceae bacterium]
MLGYTPRRERAFIDDGSADREYQDRILPHVSRTFALTIPQLPPDVRTATTSAYLLCRIADTIEDEPTFRPQETLRFLQQLNEVIAGRAEAAPLAAELESRLSDYSTPHERDLVHHMGRIISATRRLDPRQQSAIRRCLDVMSYGMHHFQCTASLRGLRSLEELDSYCYYVAGVVGEMLTELFCSSSPEIERNAHALRRLAPSFGQGLQMTNILKDIWEDRQHGASWLPRDIFARRGVDIERLDTQHRHPGFAVAMDELVGIAHAHLRNALSFTLLIPSNQTGIRRFCSWAIGLALLTLRGIHKKPGFTAADQVKVSRPQVMTLVSVTNLTLHDDRLLRQLFERTARGLPLASPSSMHPAPIARALSSHRWLPDTGAQQAGDTL